MKSVRLSVFVVLILSVLLAACSSAAPTAAPQVSANEISIKGFAFNPATLTVKVGTTVKWTNNDSVIHTVTSDTGVFDSGDMPNGAVFSYTFTKAGEYPYYCIPHAERMIGKIIVTE
jgi:plastocyanin